MRKVLLLLLLSLSLIFSGCAHQEYSATMGYSSGVRDIFKFGIGNKDTFPQLQPSIQEFVKKTELLKNGCDDGWLSKNVCDRCVESLFQINNKFNEIAKEISISQSPNEVNRLAAEATSLAQKATNDIKAEIALNIPITSKIEFYTWPESAPDKPDKGIAGKCVWNGRTWIRQIVFYNGATKKDVTKKMEDYVMFLQPDDALSLKKEDLWRNYEYLVFNFYPEYYENPVYPYRR